MKFPRYLSALLLLLPLTVRAQERPPVPAVGATVPARQVVAHDPVMIRQGNTYYLFCTGPGISMWSSPDMKSWTHRASVFDPYPAWVPVEIPEFQGHLWAPDISYHGGLYYLYYSASAFGKNTSAIGLATNTTLDPDDPAYKWVDHGKIIASYPRVTNWNAIDPQVIADDDGTPYLVFGSFWGGIKLAKMTPDRFALADCWQDLPTLASRFPMGDGVASEPGPNAIEAPFIFKRGGYFYLFASIDYCCRGPRSNYKVIVGRSAALKGPYVDSKGKPLTEGGGDIILKPSDAWYGVGHCGVYTFDGADYIIYHGYDAADKGFPKLRISHVKWSSDGWPTVEPGGEAAP